MRHCRQFGYLAHFDELVHDWLEVLQRTEHERVQSLRTLCGMVSYPGCRMIHLRGTYWPLPLRLPELLVAFMMRRFRRELVLDKKLPTRRSHSLYVSYSLSGCIENRRKRGERSSVGPRYLPRDIWILHGDSVSAVSLIGLTSFRFRALLPH